MKTEEKNCLPVKKDQKLAYNIWLEDSFENLPARMEELSSAERKICIVTDDIVEKLYVREIEELLQPVCSKVTVFSFPAGEASKNLDTVRKLYGFLIQEHFERRDMLLALGGGVVGDLTGFTAATYLRGISFIQVPTTLLAQVDSSIGGKTGVDFDSYKNMVGAFYQPAMVYINAASLKTLTEEQFFCGMGEVLKHGLIKSASYYEWTIEHLSEICEREPKVLKHMIRESCRIKRDVVEKDPLEKGERALLNFGHTLGHAIEKLKNFSMLHGQCVALGYVAAAHISWKRGYLSNEEFFEIRDMNVGFDLPISFDGLEADEIIETARLDKKMEKGQIKFILLKEIGNAYIDNTVTEDEMREALNYLNADLREKND